MFSILKKFRKKELWLFPGKIVFVLHHIKKQKEEKEKLQQTGDNLFFELKKIEEEKERQQRTKEKNLENKKKEEDELIKITKIRFK